MGKINIPGRRPKPTTDAERLAALERNAWRSAWLSRASKLGGKVRAKMVNARKAVTPAVAAAAVAGTVAAGAVAGTVVQAGRSNSAIEELHASQADALSMVSANAAQIDEMASSLDAAALELAKAQQATDDPAAIVSIRLALDDLIASRDLLAARSDDLDRGLAGQAATLDAGIVEQSGIVERIDGVDVLIGATNDTLAGLVASSAAALSDAVATEQTARAAAIAAVSNVVASLSGRVEANAADATAKDARLTADMVALTSTADRLASDAASESRARTAAQSALVVTIGGLAERAATNEDKVDTLAMRADQIEAAATAESSDRLGADAMLSGAVAGLDGRVATAETDIADLRRIGHVGTPGIPESYAGPRSGDPTLIVDNFQVRYGSASGDIEITALTGTETIDAYAVTAYGAGAMINYVHSALVIPSGSWVTFGDPDVNWPGEWRRYLFTPSDPTDARVFVVELFEVTGVGKIAMTFEQVA